MILKNSPLFALLILLLSTHLKSTQIISLGSSIVAMEALDENTFAVGLRNGIISIFSLDPNCEYSCKAKLTGHTKGVTSLAKLNDSTFASGSSDRTLRIWQKSNDCIYACTSVLVGHIGIVRSMIALDDNSFITVPDNGVAIIWEKNAANSYEIAMEASHQIEERIITSVTKLNGFGFAVIGGNRRMTFYKRLNDGTYKNLSNNSVYLNRSNFLIQLDNGDIIVVFSEYIGMFDAYSRYIDTFVLHDDGNLEIGPSLGACDNLKPVHQLSNNTFASITYDSNEIKIWEPYRSNFEPYYCYQSIKERCRNTKNLKSHSSTIKTIIQLNNEDIASGSLDGFIEIWTKDDRPPRVASLVKLFEAFV